MDTEATGKKSSAVRPALCSFANGPHRELIRRVLPTWQAWADSNGFDIVIRSDNLSGRPPSWMKVPIIYEQLRNRPLVLWVDADAYFARSDAPLNLPEEAGFAVRTTEGSLGKIPQLGVIAARPQPWVFDLLGEMWRQEDLIESAWWEQTAFMRLCGFTWKQDGRPHPYDCQMSNPTPAWERCSALDERFNVTGLSPVDDPIIHHMNGISHEQRMSILDDAGL